MSRLSELIEQYCPEGVEYRALGEVGEFSRGSSFQKKHFTEFGTPCIHYGQIHTRFNISTDQVVSFLDDDFAARMKRAKPGDLIIATTSEDDDAVGKAVAWLGDTDVVVSNDAYIFHHECDSLYMAYVFASDLFQEAKRSYITGTKVRRINDRGMSKVRIPIPPIEVQREVVRILDEYTAAHDELVRRLSAEVEYLHEEQSQLLHRELAKVIIEAERIPLGRLYEIRSPKRIHTREQVSEGVPFYKLADIGMLIGGSDACPKSCISNERYDELVSDSYVPAVNDILVTARGTLGKCYLIRDDDKFYFQDGMITWLHRTKDSPCSEFLAFLFEDTDFRNHILSSCSSGTSIRYISNRSLSQVLIPVPSEGAQLAFVRFAKRACDVYQNLITSLKLEAEFRNEQLSCVRNILFSFREKAS